MQIGPFKPQHTHSHQILDVSQKDSTARLYEKIPKALEELKEVEGALDRRVVQQETRGPISRIAKAIFQGREPPKVGQEEKKEALLNLLTNSLSVQREAAKVLFSSTPEQQHLQVVDFSGTQHDITILKRLGEGALAVAVRVDDLVGGTEREAVLLVGKSPITQEMDFVEDPLRFKSKTLDEQQESKRLYDRLKSHGIDWTPVVHSVMVLKHPTIGYTKAELQEPLKPLGSLQKRSSASKERFALRLVEAMEKTHRKGLTHGDVKPDNIMLRGRTRPVLIDWDLKLMLDRSKLEGCSREQFLSLTEERRFGTTDFLPSGYCEKIDALQERGKSCSSYEFEQVKSDFIKLQKDKDNFGLACALFEIVVGEAIPRLESGDVDRESALEKMEAWNGASKIRYFVKQSL